MCIEKISTFSSAEQKIKGLTMLFCFKFHSFHTCWYFCILKDLMLITLIFSTYIPKQSCRHSVFSGREQNICSLSLNFFFSPSIYQWEECFHHVNLHLISSLTYLTIINGRIMFIYHSCGFSDITFHYFVQETTHNKVKEN